MKLRHITPCVDCPFRRDSVAAWLGGTSLSVWVHAWSLDGPFPCHKTVRTTPAQQPDWDDSSYCAGALTMMKNSCKLPRDPDTAAAVKLFAADREKVFTHIGEFAKHHEGAE